MCTHFPDFFPFVCVYQFFVSDIILPHWNFCVLFSPNVRIAGERRHSEENVCIAANVERRIPSLQIIYARCKSQSNRSALADYYTENLTCDTCEPEFFHPNGMQTNWYKWNLNKKLTKRRKAISLQVYLNFPFYSRKKTFRPNYKWSNANCWSWRNESWN